jgi:hypothetical protein
VLANPNTINTTENFIFFEISSCYYKSSPSNTPGLNCNNNCKFFSLSLSLYAYVRNNMASFSDTTLNAILLFYDYGSVGLSP